MSSMTEQLLATIHAWQSPTNDVVDVDDDSMYADQPDTDFKLEDEEEEEEEDVKEKEIIDEYAPSDPEDEGVTITIPIAVVRAMIKRTRRFPTGEQAITRCAELRSELDNLLILYGSTPSSDVASYKK